MKISMIYRLKEHGNFVGINMRRFLDKFKAIRNKEVGLLNRGRIVILVQLLIAFSMQSVVLLVIYCFQEPSILGYRIGILLLLLLLGLVLIFKEVSWKKIGHYFIFCLTCLVWSNMLLLQDGINIVTVQYVLIIISGGYYILGFRWGLIYSLVNTLSVVALFFIKNFSQIDLSIGNLSTNYYEYSFALVFNFLLLIFIHHYFFRAFKKTSRKERILTAYLKKSLFSAEKVAAAKTNFLATMSHELRTPLNAVIGMTNVLLEDNPRAGQKENLEILSFSSENLMSTINNILSFNRLDAGMEQLENTSFRLDLLLSNIYGALKLRVLNEDLAFELDMDDRIKAKLVMGDQIRLTQIFFNLVGNAIKFTASGFVKIRAIVVMADSDRLKIKFEIEDSGIGIPELQQARVFEPYFRAEHHSADQFQGTGLGLSIARRLVDLHGGVLNFKSEQGIGTLFSFELTFPELINEEVSEDIMSGELNTKIGHLRILIAEDNPVNVMVLQKTLTRWGLVADVAENGQLALNAVVAKPYDLVFMDINMPVMSGFEASKQIRELSDPQKNKVCIIALTASIGMSLEEHPELRYLDDFLLKPFSVEQLKAKLEQSARMEHSNYKG
ncbi:ATP-binding protein [Pedobacter gandavensis]|uniref:ATP-binding protein n=1 Tax=Pedobacter gandavensis TaxID=2679963 RepID=UPI00247A09BB|nr:ATP-binding protein [Pedobacter gandavensis]WGQ10616.1 ATP-binding protein [Pedobacter gandavensis]